jgi:hypothetical protein
MTKKEETKKGRYNNMILELATMIESGSLMVGALGLSENSANYIRDELKKIK